MLSASSSGDFLRVVAIAVAAGLLDDHSGLRAENMSVALAERCCGLAEQVDWFVE